MNDLFNQTQPALVPTKEITIVDPFTSIDRMLMHGISTLSNTELMQTIVGNAGSEVMKACRFNLNELGKLSFSELKRIPGIGIKTAACLVAAIELGRRRQCENLLERIVVKTSHEIAEFLKVQLKDLNYEVFGIIFLNRANRIKHFEIISRGGITFTVCDPRIILKRALEENATSLVLTHNHPSGSTKPSRADEELTQKIKNAAKFFDIAVLDHIIVSEQGYYSFADEGIL